jgi:hypothetical protein
MMLSPWIRVEDRLPREFEEVLFIVDDDSAEGMLYFGYRDGDKFFCMYAEDGEPFEVGKYFGVAFWCRVPCHSRIFEDTPRRRRPYKRRVC